MLIPNHSSQRRPLNRLLRIGLVFMVLASLSQTLVSHGGHFSGLWMGFLIGLCYGLSITCLLGGLAQSRRRKRNTEDTQNCV